VSIESVLLERLRKFVIIIVWIANCPVVKIIGRVLFLLLASLCKGRASGLVVLRFMEAVFTKDGTDS
jgi:hypothetical protein